MRATLIIFFIFLQVLSVHCAEAQSPNASIRGMVLDPDGKRIPGAEIIVVSDATSVKYVTSTNDEGFYIVENLPPGSYRIQASKFGFKGIIKPDLILNVQDGLSLNFTLPVGASAITVTVEGGAPMLNTTDASVSTVVDRQFAENLPMNGRSFQTLIYLTPGVIAASPNPEDNGQFNVNGQRASANYWTVDGVSANVGVGASAAQAGGNGLGGTLGSFSALGGTNSLVSVDAMQEFRIQTSTYAPEFGRTPGGQISIVTRSGGDQFHGTAFDYVRNDSLDASNWFADSSGLPKPRENQNDFGGTFSGPLQKDRTFFFFSYEGLRLRLPQVSLTTVPDSVARTDAQPAMQPYLNAFPLPNGGEGAAVGTAEFNSSYSNPASLDAYSLRVDQKMGQRWAFLGRYSYSPSKFDNRGASDNSPLSVVNQSSIHSQTVTAAAICSASSAFSNDLRFNWSRTDARSSYLLDSYGGAVPLANLPFPTPITANTGNFSLYIGSLINGGELLTGPENRITQRQLNVIDGLSWQEGSHSLKFGLDYRRLWPLLAPVQYRQLVNFVDVPSAETGAAIGGRVGSATSPTMLFRNLGAYVQDTWRLNARLTVTYGLRWDVDFAPGVLSGPNIPAVTGYDLSNLANLNVAPAGTPPFKTTFGNFAPRVGGAYRISPDQKWETVLRGGFGVFYDLVSSEAGNLLGSRFPPLGFNAFLRKVAFPYSAEEAAPPAIPATGTIAEIFAFNPHLELPYTLEWNLSLEQSLGEQQAISASYVGASGRRLLQTSYFSSPTSNPEILIGQFVDNTSKSNYQALQLQFRRRLSRGLQGLVSYTFSHSIDDGSAGSAGVPSNLSIPGGNPNANRASSDFDIRHTLTAGITYDLPSPSGRSFWKFALRGWSTDDFLVARSAMPVGISDVNFTTFNSGVVGDIRPDLVPNQPLYLHSSAYPGGKAFNPGAFEDPPADPSTGNPLRQGTAPRNFLRGFGAWQWDCAIHRQFSIHEGWRLEFRGEMFNVLNHPNFGPPSNQFGAGGFGVSSQTLGQYLAGSAVGGGGFSSLYQIGSPRSIQLALKLIF